MQGTQLLKITPLEELLSNRIGYGEAQKKLSRPIYLLLFSEGCQSIVLGLLLPQLGHQWNIGAYQKSLLITMVYVGVSLGSFIQTYSDKIGRYSFIQWDAIIQTIFGLASCFCSSFAAFVICRFFYGVGIGIILPLSGSYLSQITPASQIAWILSHSRVYWSFGCLTSCFLGWMLLQGKHWRTLLFLICIPGIYALYDHIKNGRESLRYLWVRRKVQQTKQLIDFMTENNKKETISKQQIQILINQQQEISNQSKLSFSQLFNVKYYKISIIMSFAWVSVCFIYYGVMLLLPTILDRNGSFSLNYQYFFISFLSIIEVFSFYISSFIMDSQTFGRKRTVYISFGIIAISTILVVIVGQSNRYALFILFISIKLCVTIGFMVLYPYTSEIYETMLRGKAMGLMSCFGRSATAVLGITGIAALSWFNGNGLYLIFIIMSTLSCYLVYQMPYCTRGRPLDL